MSNFLPCWDRGNGGVLANSPAVGTGHIRLDIQVQGVHLSRCMSSDLAGAVSVDYRTFSGLLCVWWFMIGRMWLLLPGPWRIPSEL